MHAAGSKPAQEKQYERSAPEHSPSSPQPCHDKNKIKNLNNTRRNHIKNKTTTFTPTRRVIQRQIHRDLITVMPFDDLAGHGGPA
jgi:hypothetical protein